MGRKLVDLTGRLFGRLTVKEYVGREHHSSMWICVCECGAQVKAMSSGLRSGGTLSCGCWRRDRMSTLTLKHGQRGGERRGNSPEYKTWDSMRERCNNPESKDWPRYGGKGVTVCERWGDFTAFLADMGPRPSNGHSIDRKDSRGGYSPENCRWATAKEQARNRSSNRIVEWQGEVAPLVVAAERAGIRYFTVKARIGKGWAEHDALSRPVDQQRRERAG